MQPYGRSGHGPEASWGVGSPAAGNGAEAAQSQELLNRFQPPFLASSRTSGVDSFGVLSRN